MSVQEDAKNLEDAIKSEIENFETAHPELVVEDVSINRVESFGIGAVKTYPLSYITLKIVLIHGK